jgi:serine/threonine protein phosphatase 1
VNSSASGPAPNARQEPSRVYAIGDIHGRADLLDRMIEAIARDLAQRPTQTALTVTVGDYVDRGPDSRGVIERLTRNPFRTPFVALRGNHESIFEEFLRDPSIADYWRRLGGLETLHSYGVDVAPLMRGRGHEEAAAALRAALPQSHVTFLASLRLTHSVGRYFLCHAGVRPGVPLARQREEDLLWIREEFLDSRADFGKVVVHGHTPCEAPELRPNRINVDTGAFMSGQLTCAVLEDEGVRFLVAS